MKFFQEIIKNSLKKLKLEITPALDLDEAVFLWSKSYSITKKQNSSHWKHKGVQDQNRYSLEDYNICI